VHWFAFRFCSTCTLLVSAANCEHVPILFYVQICVHIPRGKCLSLPLLLVQTMLCNPINYRHETIMSRDTQRARNQTPWASNCWENNVVICRSVCVEAIFVCLYMYICHRLIVEIDQRSSWRSVSKGPCVRSRYAKRRLRIKKTFYIFHVIEMLITNQSIRPRMQRDPLA